MRSKTSCFNKTVFKKNLLRFAPVWGVYTLCLVVGILLIYGNGGVNKRFYFAYHMADMVTIMAVVNLLYAPIVAQLLFGDLYSSRMCNMLHAFPLRRESWFLTNVLSGLTFSVVPTLIMALLSFPLLAGSIFEGAFALSGWIFLASNLQFICFFGMAVFCVMVVGNRFTMLAAYGLLNAGAAITYWLINTVYTPMLYGVITPEQLMNNLTPVYHMVRQPYIQITTDFYQLRELFGDDLKGAIATYTITENWWRLWVLAGVGAAFSLLGLVLYKLRDLECAGSAVAFPILRPVFQVCCAVFVAAAAQFFLYNFLGMYQRNFLILTVGLVTGWFIGKMLTEHTTRVFNIHNFCGLAALAAVCAVSLWLTHVDILRIETRLPEAEKIKYVQYAGQKFTETEDIDNILRLHADALEHRAEDAGTYVLIDGQWIGCFGENYDKYVKDVEDSSKFQYTYVDNVSLTYEMESGKLIKRRYNIWTDTEYVDSEAGRISESYLTRWDTVNSRTVTIDGVEHKRLDLILKNVEGIHVDYMENSGRNLDELAKELAEDADSLIAAIKADCAAGNMAQNYLYHSGSFRIENEYSETGYNNLPEIGISISGEEYSWWVSVYPDSEHTLRWLENHGVLMAEITDQELRW